MSDDEKLERKVEQRKENIDKNLDLLRTIYGVSYILGYRELASQFPIEFDEYGKAQWLYVFSSIALVLLSIRFFWGVGVIRR